MRAGRLGPANYATFFRLIEGPAISRRIRSGVSDRIRVNVSVTVRHSQDAAVQTTRQVYSCCFGRGIF
eukprot:6910828-Pyramimonas_sp.AAC.1